MTSAYTQEQFDLDSPDGVEDHYWIAARNKILFLSINKNNLSHTSILEVGCGRGVVVNYLRKKSLNCFGLEPALVKPFAGGEKYIISGRNAIDMDNNFKNKFETLLLLDVLEHIENPNAFVREIFTHYKNIKNLIITVPAREELWSNYDEVFGHFRRYDLSMMQKTIQESGLKTIENRYFFHALYFPAKIILKLFKKRKTKMETPNNIMKLIHRLIANYFILEYKVVFKNWLGTSIICIAKKE